MKKNNLLLWVFALATLQILFSIVAYSQTNDKFKQSRDAIPNRYIVILSKDVSSQGFSPPNLGDEKVRKSSSELALLYGGRIERLYSRAIRGYSVEMSREQAIRLSQDPRVDFVEEDYVIYKDQTQSNATNGLDRIDQRNLPLDTTYNYSSTGAGVHAYVIDSGIRATHSEFTGRIGNGQDFVNDGQGTNDCDGHGTHVSGTIGGTTYGVAKDVILHPLRIFNCDGKSTGSGSLAAVDWVTANRVPNAPGVVNMSLGGGYSSSSNNAIANSIAQTGLTYVVSAGNDNNDACDKSPASTPQAITVGSSNPTNDFRSSFSNYGVCVDVFAPGSSISSAWHTSDTAAAVISGTSMSAPHVSGIVARFLQNNPVATPSQVENSVINSATSGVMVNPGVGSPNRLAFADVVLNNTTPAPPTPGPAPAVRIPEQGTGTPYPSEYVVSGGPTVIGSASDSIEVQINGFSHTATGEVSFLLEGPTGAKILLQSGVGLNEDANNVSYTFRDDGSVMAENSPLLTNFVYKPTAYDSINFPAPGPGTIYNSPGPLSNGIASLVSTFGGTNSNGIWKLYVKDENLGDRGRIDSWSVTARSLAPPTAPSNLQTNPNLISDTYIGLQWNSNPTNQSIVSYNLRVNGGAPISVSNTTSSLIGYVANGLSPGTTYTFEVQAVNILGATSSFSIITATTLPSAPANLRISVVSSTQIDISWNANPVSQNVAFYNVRINGGPMLPTVSTNYSATGLFPSTNYSFEVQAVTASNVASSWSNISGTTPSALTPPPAGVSNAVYDYSSTQNHQFSMWQYGVKSSANSFIRYLHNGQIVNGVNAWSENSGGKCCTMVARNITGGALVYQGVINQPIDILNLHPGVNGEKATVRWTAQISGFVRLQGRFEGIDIAGTSSDGNISHNNSLIWNNNINGYGAKAYFDIVVQVNAGDVIDFAVGYGSNNTYYNDSTGVEINISATLPPSGGYNAVNDFSASSNGNKGWWYGESYKTYTENGQIVSGVSAWSLNPGGRCCSMVAKNTTGSSLIYQGVINQPADMLNLHPGVYGEKAKITWRSPIAGYFRVVGRFQGIDIAGTTSDVSISRGGSVIWSSDINGFGATATFDMVVQVNIGDGIDFEVGYGSNNTYYNDSTGFAVDITPTTAPPPSNGIYNAVNDFSPNSNFVGPWRYGVKKSVPFQENPTFTPYFRNGQIVSGVTAWSENPNGRCCTMVAKNMTSAGMVYQGVINQPADMLNLHPGANGEKATVRWIAPATGTYRLEGRFQGIDIAGTSSDVSINWNVSTIWNNNINGFGSAATFDLIVSASAGTTIDFVVGYGSNNNYYNDSTGLAVNITQITAPPPPSGVYDAVNDLIPTSNPTGVWSYGFKSSPTSFVKYNNNGQIANGIRAWSENPSGRCCTMIAKNTTGMLQNYETVINQPADLLNLHPGINGEKAAVRWTAPEAGYYRLEGRFQGIDIAGTSSDGSIIKNGSMIWTNNINGYESTAAFDMVVQVSQAEAIDFAVGFGVNNSYYNDSTGFRVTITKTTAPPPPTGIYNAVSDFSPTINPNGTWQYGVKTAPTSFTQYTSNGQPVNGILSWGQNPNGACCPWITKNTTGILQLYYGVIRHPANLLSLHPGANGEKSTVRWTAPASGNFRLQGSFEGLDLTGGISTDASILKNGTILWTNNVNGFGTVVSFDLIVSVNTGDVMDFAVGYGNNNNYYNDSTGFNVNISPTTVLVADTPKIKSQLVAESVNLDNRVLGKGLKSLTEVD